VQTGHYTPQPQSGCSMSVALATAGRLRKPQNAGKARLFFQKMKRLGANFLLKRKKKK